MANDSVHRCAFVQHDGNRVLVVELEPDRSAEALADLQRALGWANLADVRIVDKIPVDKRHNAKVDYPALRTLLLRRSATVHPPITSS